MRRLLWGAGLAAIMTAGGAAAAALLPLPLAAQLWLARTYPDYFLSEFEDWRARHNIVDEAIVRLIAAKSLRDWQSREAAWALQGDRRMALKHLAADVNALTITHHQIFHNVMDQPAYARLVFGLAACDSLNHLLLLPAAQIYDADLYYLYDEKAGLSPHTLVNVHADGGDIFADVFNGPDVYTFADPAGFATVSVDAGPVSGVAYPRDWFTAGGRWKDGIREATSYGDPPPNPPVPLPIPDAAAPWVPSYLEARLLQIAGELDAAERKYREAAELCADTSDAVCQAARVFAGELAAAALAA